jgi:hypothetical protein
VVPGTVLWNFSRLPRLFSFFVRGGQRGAVFPVPRVGLTVSLFCFIILIRTSTWYCTLLHYFTAYWYRSVVTIRGSSPKPKRITSSMKTSTTKSLYFTTPKGTKIKRVVKSPTSKRIVKSDPTKSPYFSRPQRSSATKSPYFATPKGTKIKRVVKSPTPKRIVKSDPTKSPYFSRPQRSGATKSPYFATPKGTRIKRVVKGPTPKRIVKSDPTKSPYFTECIEIKSHQSSATKREDRRRNESTKGIKSQTSCRVHNSSSDSIVALSVFSLGPLVYTWCKSWCRKDAPRCERAKHEVAVCFACKDSVAEVLSQFSQCPEFQNLDPEKLFAMAQHQTKQQPICSCIELVGSLIEKQVRHLCQHGCYLRAFAPCREWIALSKDIDEQFDQPAGKFHEF